MNVPYMHLLPAPSPTTADERIRSIIAKGQQFVEYEVASNGDVLGAVRAPSTRLRSGWTDWMDVLVPADGAKARLI